MLVAVYGTLKKGYENYDRYLASSSASEPLYELTAQLPYAMFASAEYPMLVPSNENHPVRLELFEVDTSLLADLDALEEPYHYERRTVRLKELGRFGEEIGLYVHPGEPPSHFRRVVSGDWRRENF